MALVVFIHNDFTVESIAETVANGGQAIAFCPSPFGEWVQRLVSQGIARGAVPLFFLFAGYLQAKKNDSYGLLLKKRARSLLLPFALWMGLYAFVFSGAKLVIAQIAPSLVANPGTSALTYSASDWFHNFLGYKLKSDGTFTNPGFAIQFWFVRDLLILVVLSPVFRYLLAKFPISTIALSGLAFLTPFPVFFVNAQSLFFYLAGICWAFWDIRLFEKTDSIHWRDIILVFALSFSASEIFFGGDGPLHGSTVLAAAAALVKLSAIIARSPKYLATFTWLGGFSFFLFAIHAPILNQALQKIWIHFFPMENAFFALFEYFGVAFLDIALGTGIGMALKKIAPAVFNLLNGGRH